MTPALFSRVSQTQSPVDSPRARSSSSPRLDPMSPGGALNMSSMSARPPAFNETVDLIRSEHFTAARSSVHSPDILRELEMEIEHDCDTLRSFLFATQVIDEISPRSRDTIIGFGERLACKVMTAILRDWVRVMHTPMLLALTIGVGHRCGVCQPREHCSSLRRRIVLGLRDTRTRVL